MIEARQVLVRWGGAPDQLTDEKGIFAEPADGLDKEGVEAETTQRGSLSLRKVTEEGGG